MKETKVCTHSEQKSTEILISLLTGKQFVIPDWHDYKVMGEFFIVEDFNKKWIAMFRKSDIAYMILREHIPENKPEDDETNE